MKQRTRREKTLFPLICSLTNLDFITAAVINAAQVGIKGRGVQGELGGEPNPSITKYLGLL